MQIFNIEELKKLYIPLAGSHKGQNGRLLVIGGSQLFHAASLWALNAASKIADMVFYSSVPENNQIVAEAKREFRNGIVVTRDDLDRYVNEADAIVIGPGMMRTEISNLKSQISNLHLKSQSLKNINEMEDEGEQAYYLTKYLLEKYPEKKWVIDAGALQMMELEWLKQLEGRVILTPHEGEFYRLFLKDKEIKDQRSKIKATDQNLKIQQELVGKMAKKYNCIILLKGQEDVVCGPFDSAQGEIRCCRISGGNAGMTKGGTGDVLAGLVGALACNNDLWLSATAGSYINKKAGDSLFEKVGYYFNATDLVDEIPRVMRELIDYV